MTKIEEAAKQLSIAVQEDLVARYGHDWESFKESFRTRRQRNLIAALDNYRAAEASRAAVEGK